MRISRFLKTSTFRLALLYAALFCASFLALFVFIYLTTDVLIERQRTQTIVADMNGLTDQFDALGLAALGDAILERTQPGRAGDSIYLLTDANFKPLAGNLSRWPHEAKIEEPWLVFPIERKLFGDPEPHLARALHAILPGGYHLLVGSDTRAQERFKRANIQALAWSIAVTLCLGIGVGVIMSRNMLRRLEAINQVAEQIMQGEVGRRMPVDGSRDEYDRLAENLNAMLEEIERLMGGLRAVTNNIAHDLRSPLTRLKNRLEQALAVDQDAPQRRLAIEQAADEADGLLATFNALLSIAGAEAGAGRADMAPVDLEALGRDVAELYEPVLDEQGLRFDSTFSGPAIVSANRQLLFQVIANLIDNAVKYAAGGGRIALSVQAVDGAPEVVVADCGPGIPAEDRGRVLERFVRLDSSRSTPGNGLGLSLVAAIVRLHGASLILGDNAPGLKVTVRFKPVNGTADPSPQQPRRSSAPEDGRAAARLSDAPARSGA